MTSTPFGTVHTSMAQQGLVRPHEGRVLAGVCAGLGQRFGLEPWPARLLFALVLLLVPGSQILLYPVLWILMPTQVPGTPALLGPPAAAPPKTA